MRYPQVFKIFLLFFALCFFAPFFAQGAMQSSSYVIYENVMHSFDGPVISGVNSSVSGLDVDITWNTDVLADSFVVYDTVNPFTNSKEQGHSAKTSTSHSVSLSGLSANTTYYYRVRSERINGGISNSSIYSFTTGSESASSGTEEESTPAGGGGILIIDKTDKVPPVISEINVNIGENNQVEITWKTDEEATEFVEYGQSKSYGSTFGKWASSTEHKVVLQDLKPDFLYHFRVLSSDSWGNVAYSEDMAFSTGKGIITDEKEIEEIEKQQKEEGAVETEPDENAILAKINENVIKFLKRLFPEASLNNLKQDEVLQINSLEDLSKFAPTPILSGQPRVQVGDKDAVIFWTTDVDANSLVALAPEDVYLKNIEEPYQMIVGNSEEKTKRHEVKIFNLSPDTTYHFQLRSKAGVGPMARSKDFTFKTKSQELKISNFFAQVLSDQSAVFKWVTNKEADSAVKFAPYHNNILAIDESKTVKNNEPGIIHEVKIEDFQPGVNYSVELISVDNFGNIVSEKMDPFSTAEDDLPPIISHIKTDSTIFVDRKSKIQTVISWMTNEPATSRVYYEEGVHGKEARLKESTELNDNYTKEHVIVITKFKPGVVYSFRVESIDSGGNVTLSKPHTFMTAKKKESIIQIIMNILENTFGWLKKLM